MGKRWATKEGRSIPLWVFQHRTAEEGSDSKWTMRIETAAARIHKRCCELNRSTSKPTCATAGTFRAGFSMGNQIQAYLPRGSNPTELERLCFQ